MVEGKQKLLPCITVSITLPFTRQTNTRAAASKCNLSIDLSKVRTLFLLRSFPNIMSLLFIGSSWMLLLLCTSISFYTDFRCLFKLHILLFTNASINCIFHYHHAAFFNCTFLWCLFYLHIRKMIVLIAYSK